MEVRVTRWLLFATASFVLAAIFFALAAFGTSAIPGFTVVAQAAATSANASPPPATLAPPTRYDQSDPAISYTGKWGTQQKSAASAHSYARSNAAGAAINIAFNGTRLDWIATQNSTGGVADVYLDGVFVKTVDLRAKSAAYQSIVWSSGPLAAGVHTVRIIRSAASASGTYLTIDAVDITGTDTTGTAPAAGALLKCQWLDQTSTLLAYETTCVTASFTGTHLAWVGQRDPARGVATVTVDGGPAISVDLQGISTPYQQKLWDTGRLAEGAHTITIEWVAGYGTLATGASGGADGFLVAGTVTQAYVWHRLQDGDPRVLYWGTWSANPVFQASGGSDKRASAGQSIVTVTFNGKQLDWLATIGPGLGDANVSVDSSPAQVVHLAGATTLYQQNVWSTGTLAAGTHTVQISWDAKNAAGAAIDVDAFDVLGMLPATTDVAALRTMWAEQKLVDLSYRPGKVDGVADRQTRGAVIAFQKWEGLPRNGKLADEIFARLLTATRPVPTKVGGSDSWIEVDKTKQVLLYCKAGAVLWTIPVSSGSPSVGFATPSGTYKIMRKTLETNPRWHPLYLRSYRYLAIHGYPSVPTSRASHGCVRTQIWDQRELYPLIPVGTNVYIY